MLLNSQFFAVDKVLSAEPGSDEMRNLQVMVTCCSRICVCMTALIILVEP